MPDSRKLREQRIDSLDREWPGEEIALRQSAPERPQFLRLLIRLHALGNHL